MPQADELSMETRIGIKPRLPLINCLSITYQGVSRGFVASGNPPLRTRKQRDLWICADSWLQTRTRDTTGRVQMLFRQSSAPLPGRRTFCIGRASSAIPKRAAETEIRGVLMRRDRFFVASQRCAPSQTRSWKPEGEKLRDDPRYARDSDARMRARTRIGSKLQSQGGNLRAEVVSWRASKDAQLACLTEQGHQHPVSSDRNAIGETTDRCSLKTARGWEIKECQTPPRDSRNRNRDTRFPDDSGFGAIISRLSGRVISSSSVSGRDIPRSINTNVL